MLGLIGSEVRRPGKGIGAWRLSEIQREASGERQDGNAGAHWNQLPWLCNRFPTNEWLKPAAAKILINNNIYFACKSVIRAGFGGNSSPLLDSGFLGAAWRLDWRSCDVSCGGCLSRGLRWDSWGERPHPAFQWWLTWWLGAQVWIGREGDSERWGEMWAPGRNGTFYMAEQPWSFHCTTAAVFYRLGRAAPALVQEKGIRPCFSNWGVLRFSRVERTGGLGEKTVCHSIYFHRKPWPSLHRQTQSS